MDQLIRLFATDPGKATFLLATAMLGVAALLYLAKLWVESGGDIDEPWG